MSTLKLQFLLKALPLLLLALLPPGTIAQLKAGAAISLVARLQGTVSVREAFIPFTIVIAGGQQRTSPVQFEVNWNLDPRETRSFRMIATCSLQSSHSARLTIRVDDSDFRYFSAASRLVLLSVPIGRDNRQGRGTHTLALLFDPTSEIKLPDGEYRGSLTLTVEQQ